MSRLNFGYDPEFFALNSNNNIVSAHRMPDTFYNKYERMLQVTGGSRQFVRDGAAIEINTQTAQTCRDWSVPATFHALKKAHTAVQKTFGKTVRLAAPAAAKITKRERLSAPEDVSQFGCAPDIDAYTLENNQPVMPDNFGMRFTGGHIHLSDRRTLRSVKRSEGEMGDLLPRFALNTMFLDALVGLPSVGVMGEKYFVNESQRRQFYGQAGAFRPQQYTVDGGFVCGFEYRVLSGRSFMQHPILMSMWIGLARQTFPNLWNGCAGDSNLDRMFEELCEFADPEEIRRVINENDYEWVWENSVRWEKWAISLLLSIHDGVEKERLLPGVLMRAAQQGTYFGDDLAYNWGYSHPKFSARSHNYWQVLTAASGRLDPSIFPQQQYLEGPKKEGTFVHPNTDFGRSGSRNASRPVWYR